MDMGFFVLLLVASCITMSSATVFKVGDAVGWTIGKIDYGTWASKKIFHVGDTLLFEYSSQYHNVMEVTKSSYDSCSTKSPMSTHATGNDSIAIKSEGDHFFLCGIPGHCAGGQKLKVSALAKSGSSAAPSTSPTTAPVPSGSPMTTTPSSTASASPAPPAPAPAKSHAAPTFTSFGFTFAASLAAALV